MPKSPSISHGYWEYSSGQALAPSMSPIEITYHFLIISVSLFLTILCINPMDISQTHPLDTLSYWCWLLLHPKIMSSSFPLWKTTYWVQFLLSYGHGCRVSAIVVLYATKFHNDSNCRKKLKISPTCKISIKCSLYHISDYGAEKFQDWEIREDCYIVCSWHNGEVAYMNPWQLCLSAQYLPEI